MTNSILLLYFTDLYILSFFFVCFFKQKYANEQASEPTAEPELKMFLTS